VPLFSTLLTLHIALAIALLLPSLLLPFALRSRRWVGSHGWFVRFLLYLQATGTIVITAGLAVTGFGLVALLGPQLLTQPWLIVALSIYVANLVIALVIQRPSLRFLVRFGGFSGPAEEEHWRALARRQRYVAYTMAALVGLIAFLMNTKPQLW